MRPGLLAKLLLAAVFAGGMSAAAQAQYLSGPAYAFPIPDMIGPAIVGTSMQSYLGRGSSSPSSSQRGSPATGATGLGVASDPATSRKVRAEFRSQLALANPGKEAAIDQALAQDWLAGYQAEIARPNGLDPRNLADSVTAYLIASWAIVHKQERISPRAIASVRDRFRASLVSDPRLSHIGAAERQEMSEQLIHHTVLIMANRTRIAETKDTALADAAARHYQEAVQSGLHIDLRALRLTDQGFVPN